MGTIIFPFDNKPYQEFSDPNTVTVTKYFQCLSDLLICHSFSSNSDFILVFPNPLWELLTEVKELHILDQMCLIFMFIKF